MPGKVMQCSKCKRWRPVRKEAYACPFCEALTVVSAPEIGLTDEPGTIQNICDIGRGVLGFLEHADDILGLSDEEE